MCVNLDNLFLKDVHMLCVSGLGICGAKSGAWMWIIPESDVGDDGIDISVDTGCTCVCAILAGYFPDCGVRWTGLGGDSDVGRG